MVSLTDTRKVAMMGCLMVQRLEHAMESYSVDVLAEMLAH